MCRAWMWSERCWAFMWAAAPLPQHREVVAIWKPNRVHRCSLLKIFARQKLGLGVKHTPASLQP